ncbi:hypothetical protein HU200_067801 [Digitaria exilis]|uniref:Late embryogenesis abundant protein LEA-2 subgroup domain-containing protein n=1 Tax=Digitaria exilis TaxID=1010633 RepID=A0A834ZUF3_9POAL|nr:hypothetical protein HU200_067801 [Digitaria exilis]
MGAQLAQEGSCCRRQALIVAGWIFAVAVAITALVLLMIFISKKFPEGDPKYWVAVTAVSGLDDDLSARSRPTISPVFNVTVHMDSTRDSADGRCVPDLSTAEVSYGDAFLGKGTLPKICAGKRLEAEGVARAWGQDVVVPWFLRDQLAGEMEVGDAAVDVHLRMDGSLLVCKAKIGGGISLCREPQYA